MELHSAEDEIKCKSSCTIYVVLIIIAFIVFIGIGSYFFYYKYINHSKKTLSTYDYICQATTNY